MLLRSGTWISVHVCCLSRERDPFFLERKNLSADEKNSIPNPTGSLMNRCDVVINLNAVLDHFAFCVLNTHPVGRQDWIMRGFGRFMNWHFSRSGYTVHHISAGGSCGYSFKNVRELSMRYPIEREMGEHMGNYFNLVVNDWAMFSNCYCGGPHNNLYLEIGEDFETECYHCYASTFGGRPLEDRRTFMSYAGRLTTALVFELEERIQKKKRRICSLEDICSMASSLGSSLSRSILLAPHSHFLVASRIACNEVLGLDRLNDEGWTCVSSPHDNMPEDNQFEDPAGEDEENNSEGHASDDSEDTVPYPMPMDQNIEGEDADHQGIDTDSETDGQQPVDLDYDEEIANVA